MGTRCRLNLSVAAAVLLLAGNVYSQEAQTLGDLARQQRQQRGQSKSANGPDGKASKVITNEEIPEHAGDTPAEVTSGGAMPVSSNGTKQPAEHWTSQIKAQKGQIATLQKQMDALNESIRFAPPNCVGRCVQWNERQREKQQQVERMQAQLGEQKKRLEEMQESARKQGYGSSVYDP